MTHRRAFTRAGLALLLAPGILLSGCDGGDPTTPALRPGGVASAIVPTGTLTDATLVPEYFKVCKYGSDADFDVVTTWTGPAPARQPQSFSEVIHIGDGECKYVSYSRVAPALSSSAATVQVTEQVPAGYEVAKIELAAGPGTPINTTYTGTNTVSAQISASGFTPPGLQGAVAKFTNVLLPPTAGTAGCTPGYWKQRQHFGSWVDGNAPDWATTDNYNTVFGVSLFTGSEAGMSLLDALGHGGGGIYRLGRHSAAALLDASNGGVDYGMTPAHVIALVQQAVATGDYDAASDEFESRNERSCPLGRNP
jgi:hypothetical protein